MNRRRSRLSLATVAGVLVLLNSYAVAGFTLVMWSSEPDHREILECIYGSGFLPIGSTAFENPTLHITATRVHDFVDADPLAMGDNLVIGNPSTSATDQVWQDGFVRATARARFASYSQGLGQFPGSAGGSYTNLFDVSGSACEVTGQAEVAFNPGDTWRWARHGTGGTWSSRASDNGTGEDHMVTYEVSGVNDGNTTFLLFWEDLAGMGDRDYNDLAVELVIIPPRNVCICHVPPGNPGNGHTICIGSDAVPSHFDHGDILRPCDEPDGLDVDLDSVKR